MNLLEILKFEKENMPKAQWNLEKFLIYFIAVLLGGAILALIAGLIIGFTTDGEGVYFLIPVFVWVGITAIMCGVLIVKSKKAKAEMREFYCDKISAEFVAADCEEAKQKLIDGGIINDKGFIIPETAEWAADGLIPYGDAKFEFVAYVLSGALFLNVGPIALDADAYNFFRNNREMIVNKKVFDLFCDDKKKFVDLLVRYNSAAKIEQKLG